MFETEMAVFAILQKKESCDGSYAPKFSLYQSRLYEKPTARNITWNKLICDCEDKYFKRNYNGDTNVEVAPDNEIATVTFNRRYTGYRPSHKITYYKTGMMIKIPNMVSLTNTKGHIVLKINKNADLAFPEVVATYGVPRTIKAYTSRDDTYYCFNFELIKGMNLY